MTDRPVIFSAPMVRALLDGRKSQTRRIIGPGTATVLGHRGGAKSPLWRGLLLDHPRAKVRTQSTLMRAVVGKEAPYDLHLDVPWVHPDDAARGTRWEDDQCMYRVRPIVEVGDRLWVREGFVFGQELRGDDSRIGEVRPIYRADRSIGRWLDADDNWRDAPPWRPSIHMPRWASRLTLLVTGVKVERLQEISDANAKAEGAVCTTCANVVSPPDGFPSYRSGFGILWNQINGAGAWDANPWVVAITFTVHKANIDQMQEAA